MPLDVGRVTHLAEQMHRSEDDAGDPITDGFLLAADGARGLEWVDPSTLSGSGAPTTADYLVGTTQAGLSAEIVVGTTPGGELGGTWASPTVDATHSGSAHTDFIAKSLLTTQDDIIVRDGTGPARLAKGSDGQVLTVDPTTHHLVWATPTAGSGDVSTDTIWDAKGDLAGGTGADTAARLAVGSNGQVLTADSSQTTGMKWDTPSGGSAIAYGSNKPATPTDDFTTFSGWTAEQNNGTFATTDCYGGAIDGSHLSMGFKGAMGYVYQSASNVDQEWQCGGMRGWGQTGAVTAMMFGIALLDASEDGMGMLVYNDNNVYLARITGGQYASFDGSITNIGHNINHASRWDLRLTRVGNTWDGYASLGGQGWAFHASATGSRTITVARKCIGVFYNTADQYKGELVVDWVHTV